MSFRNMRQQPGSGIGAVVTPSIYKIILRNNDLAIAV